MTNVISENVQQQQLCSEGDSEEDSFFTGDLIAPGADHLSFGSFNTLKLGKVTVNEYGSNFMKYKQDSLVTIETKRALFENKKSDIFQLEDFGSEKKLSTILEDMGPVMEDQSHFYEPCQKESRRT